MQAFLSNLLPLFSLLRLPKATKQAFFVTMQGMSQDLMIRYTDKGAELDCFHYFPNNQTFPSWLLGTTSKVWLQSFTFCNLAEVRLFDKFVDAAMDNNPSCAFWSKLLILVNYQLPLFLLISHTVLCFFLSRAANYTNERFVQWRFLQFWGQMHCLN